MEEVVPVLFAAAVAFTATYTPLEGAVVVASPLAAFVTPLGVDCFETLTVPGATVVVAVAFVDEPLIAAFGRYRAVPFVTVELENISSEPQVPTPETQAAHESSAANSASSSESSSSADDAVKESESV